MEATDGLTDSARSYVTELVKWLKQRPTGEITLFVTEGGIHDMRASMSVKPPDRQQPLTSKKRRS